MHLAVLARSLGVRQPMSSMLTRGILVTVRSQYIPERSSASARQYAFAYTVKIANRGTVTAQLKSRHWIITDANGVVQEVQGEGVVGVTLRRACRIGGGARILPGIEVGEEAFVGAGAVVTKDVPPKKVVVGSPARVLRDVPEDELLPSD